jgi:hypothetical protein
VNDGKRAKSFAVSAGESAVAGAGFARGAGSASALLRRKPMPDFDSRQTTGAAGT